MRPEGAQLSCHIWNWSVSIFVNYGNIASLSSFPFKMENAFLLVDEKNKVAQNVFAIGDVCQYQNKTRRIAPGLNEADRVFEQITC